TRTVWWPRARSAASTARTGSGTASAQGARGSLMRAVYPLPAPRAAGYARAARASGEPEVSMAAKRAGREIQFASDGDRVKGYLALPASGRGPGVLVIQEWWGLVEHIRDACDRFAREGFVALAPDLYRGETASDPDRAGRLMMGLEVPRASRHLDGAVKA